MGVTATYDLCFTSRGMGDTATCNVWGFHPQVGFTSRGMGGTATFRVLVHPVNILCK